MPTRTAFTGHHKPTRETARTKVQEWANEYLLADNNAESIEDLDQYVRRLSVELHATIRPHDFSAVLEASGEVWDVIGDDHPEIRSNQLGTINNKPELLDYKRQTLNIAADWLLDHAGFGISEERRMSLVDEINWNNDLANAAAELCVTDILRGEKEQALDFAFLSQRHRCDAREYSETLRITSEVRR